MIIKEVKRPWEKKRQSSGKDGFYQSKYWRSTREIFRRGSTNINGFMLRNIFCYDCFLATGKQIEGSQCDHFIAKKAGGSDDNSNLRTLCDHHHNAKSAVEGNAMRLQ